MSTRAGLSLRSRVLVGLAAIAAIAIAVAVTVTVVTHTYLVDQLDQRLASFSGPIDTSRRVPPATTDTTNPDPAEDATANGEEYRPSDAVRAIVAVDGSVYVFYRSNVEGAGDDLPVLRIEDMPASGSVYLTVPSTEGDARFRVLARATSFGTDITALPLQSVEQTTSRLVLIEGLGIAGMLAGLAVVAWWVIRLGVAPMRRMVDASSRIAEGDLDVRLEGAAHGSESAELAQSLNTMIGTLTDALDERERSEARLREFVADASHELRTPLTTVLGYAELYRKGALSREEDLADAWGRTEAEAGRMRRLVEDMLELARYDAEPQLTLTTVDLSHLCREVVGDATAARDGGDVEVDAPFPVTVQGDPDRLRQAVINVVTNAAVHGGDHVRVTVAEQSGSAVVTVEDDGPGMTPEIAARATERFVRGDHSRTRSTGGSGLGLAITAAIVAVHGGVISVDSTEGVGTTVTLTLPLADG